MRVQAIIVLWCLSTVALAADQKNVVVPPPPTDVELTIYNQNFASVKERRSLTLTKGENEVRVTGMTSQLEPDSVFLRDLKNAAALRILEQNYEANPLSQQHMLRAAEGQVLDFEVTNPQTNEKRIVKAKIIRAGGGQVIPYGESDNRPRVSDGDTIVETDGRISFGLPGKPIFSALDPNAFLKPTLLWKLDAESGGKHDAEISYLSGGFRWEASYNFVADKGDTYEVVGWVTLENESGKDFDDAHIKLIAGDVNRVQTNERPLYAAPAAMAMKVRVAPGVTERAFEEYHLYTLPRPTSLLDRETKQVEFLHAAQVPATKVYVYDGARSDQSTFYERRSPGAGATSNPDVAVMLEVVNSEKNGLGIPLPKGKVKLYRRDVDGRNEFIGEDAIRHTPKDEKIRLNMGNAFDLTGERTQTNYRQGKASSSAQGGTTADESFEIKLRNHKKEPVEIRVVEHLWRSRDWTITESSQQFNKLDASTIEFRVPVKANGESTVTYTVHYKL